MPVEIASLTSKVRAIEAGSHVVAIHFVGDSAAMATGEGEILIAGGSEARIKAHKGAILAAAGDGKRIFTAGDDGKLVATDIEGETETLADSGRKVDRSGRARARGRGRVVGRKDRLRSRRQGRAKLGGSRRPWAGSPSPRRGCGSRSRITTARRSGSPTPMRSPRRLRGKARISARCFRPTAVF